MLLATSLFAQIKSEKVIVTKIDANTIELRAKLYGKFDDLRELNNANRLTYLLTEYDVGFYVENYRQLNWDSGAKTIGKVNSFRDGLGLNDTLAFSTTLTNLPLSEDINVLVYFKPKNNRYKFRLDGTEEIGTRLQDFACEPEDAAIEPTRLRVEKNDTITLSASAFVDDFCSQELEYGWEFRTYDEVITVNDTISDTTYVYSDWMNFGSGRNGYISEADNQLTFEAMNKNWDNRQWRVKVSNSVGESYSNRFTLRVNQ